MKNYVFLRILPLVYCLLLANNIGAADPDKPEPGQRRVSPIIGGVAANPYAWPWIALLGVDGSFCGGSLIHKKIILTAAHCLCESGTRTPLTTDKITVRLGSDAKLNDLNTGMPVPVQATYVHHFYDPEDINGKYDYDIGMIFLQEEVIDRAPIPLIKPLENLDLQSSDFQARVLGWGRKVSWDPSSISNELQQVDVPIVDAVPCQSSYNSFGLTWHHENTFNVVCGGDVLGGVDSCYGDSGGPFIVWDTNEGAWNLAGVTSWGSGCAQPGLYGVYTRVRMYWGLINLIALSVDPSEYNLVSNEEKDIETATAFVNGQQSVILDPSTYNLREESEFSSAVQSYYSSGQNSILINPNPYGLVSTSSIDPLTQQAFSEGESFVLSNPSVYSLISTSGIDPLTQQAFSEGESFVISNSELYQLVSLEIMNAASSSAFIEGQLWVTSQPQKFNLTTIVLDSTFLDQLPGGWSSVGTEHQVTNLSVFSNVDVVWTHQNGAWEFYSPNSTTNAILSTSYDPMTVIPAGAGMWIKK